MGIVLVCGTIMMLYIVYKRHYDIFSIENISFSDHFDKCKVGHINLRINNEIDSFTLLDNKIAVLSKPKGNNQEIVILDYCDESKEKRIQFNINKNDENQELQELNDISNHINDKIK